MALRHSTETTSASFAATLLAIAISVFAPASWGQAEVRTPLLGSPTGGDPGEWRCPRNAYLVGFDSRTSDEGFHAISAICAEYRADGSRGPMITGPRFGGMAGDSVTKVCPATKPFVRTMQTILAEGSLIVTVSFECGALTGPLSPTKLGESFFVLSGSSQGSTWIRTHAILCPASYGYAGIHARGGSDLDAIGAICQPAVPVAAPPIRNPTDRTTVLSRAAGPTLAQQSAAARTGGRTLDQQANSVANSVAGDIAGRIDANQIVCRGGPTLGVHLHGPSTTSASPANTWTVYFVPARGPAKADASGLEPGQCGYVDRAWTSGDPPGIQFDVESNAGTATPAQYLSDSGHYWSFVVANTGRGMFVANRHGKYRDSTATTVPTSKPSCGTAIVGMRNDLDSRIERIRCEDIGLTPNQRAQLNGKLDEVLRWLATAK